MFIIIFKTYLLEYTERKKLSYFDLKNWVTGGTIEFDTGFWVIGEYLSQFDSQYRVNLTLNIESIFDSNILQLIGIPDRILVPPVTQFFRSKWLNFFFQCTLVNMSWINKQLLLLLYETYMIFFHILWKKIYIGGISKT